MLQAGLQISCLLESNRNFATERNIVWKMGQKGKQEIKRFSGAPKLAQHCTFTHQEVDVLGQDIQGVVDGRERFHLSTRLHEGFDPSEQSPFVARLLDQNRIKMLKAGLEIACLPRGNGKLVAQRYLVWMTW